MNKKIVIKIGNNSSIVKAVGISPQDLLHNMTLALVNSAGKYGVAKKELLEATKAYYEEMMRHEAR